MKFKILMGVSGFFLIFLQTLNAQVVITKEQEYEKNKVQIFTVKERDNLQLWLQEELAKMNLSEETENIYKQTLIAYVARMGRLVDKDKDYTKEEILEKIDDLIKRQDAEVKKILSKDEFQIHLETYDKLLLSVRNRIAEMEF